MIKQQVDGSSCGSKTKTYWALDESTTAAWYTAPGLFPTLTGTGSTAADSAEVVRAWQAE